jgi:hypothetical protein
MSKTFTHTVAGVPGTRKSPRVYTHATVVTYDPVWYQQHKELGRLQAFELRAQQDWDYYANVLANDKQLRLRALTDDAAFAAKILARSPERAEEIAGWEGISLSSHERTIASAQKLLIRWGTREGYIAAERVAEKQRLEAEYAQGVSRGVLSWHQSPGAAAAFANTTANKGEWAAVEVCPVQRS